MRKGQMAVPIWVFVILVLFVKYCEPQRSLSCSEPCQLGYTCYAVRNRNGIMEPQCIALELYLSLVRGSDHAHTGQEPSIPARNQEPTTGTRPHLRHSIRPSGHHVHQSAGQTSDSHTHRHLESPITQGHNSLSVGQQTVLRPFDGQSTFTRQRIPETVNRVPTANQFEKQLSDNSAGSLEQLSASSSSKQSLTPVGSPSNNREKSVAEILDELVNPKSNTQTRSSSQTASTNRQSSRSLNNSKSSQRGNSQRQNDARNRMQRRNGEMGRSNNRRISRNRNSNSERNRSSRTNNSSARNINRQRNSGRGSSDPTRNTHIRPRHKLLSSSERVRQVTETANGHGQEPVVSAILQDDSGYYFMFYPQTGDSGTRINISKPGFCTRSPPLSQKTTCAIRCTSDRQCPGDLKCCPKGCDLLCTPPRRP